VFPGDAGLGWLADRLRWDGMGWDGMGWIFLELQCWVPGWLGAWLAGRSAT
jgi:hypothetical protein